VRERKGTPLRRWIVFAFLLAAVPVLAAEPPLPAGLAPEKKPEEPALPSGLDGTRTTSAEPPLPGGLENADAETPSAEARPPGLPLDLAGFWEVRYGRRLVDDDHERSTSIAETRVQLDVTRWFEDLPMRPALRLTLDLLCDQVESSQRIRLEEGKGFADLRQASLGFSPLSWMDVKLGRQILTWGTGDLVFINDLFPKDWVSFFNGRDVEYLKAPSDAVKVSLFSDAVNLDFVYTPRFDADRFIRGERISYYSGSLGRIAGRDAIVDEVGSDDWCRDDEVAARLYRNVGAYELAAYFYDGYWKSPGGMNAAGRAVFPRLRVTGVSARGTLLKGIVSAETGHYDSRDDPGGRDAMIRNSEFRFLLGYEREVAQDFTAAVQYYLEHMLNHGRYRRTLPAGSRPADRNRHVLALRLTKLLVGQDLTLSLFTYYSPSDQDAYLRPKVHYRFTDRWAGEVGGNVFLGEHAHTFFGQFQDNTNAYGGLRFSF